MQIMNELRFLELVHKSAVSRDKWGWSEHFVGPYKLQTNGTAYNTFMAISGKRIPLQKVIRFAQTGEDR